MATLQQKMQISAGSAILFMAVNLPETYRLTNKILPCKLIDGNCPTSMGVFIHTAVFFLVTLLTMGDIRENTFEKLKHSIYGTLIFFFLSSPTMYSLTQNKCPTFQGVLLHTFLYFIALVGLMYLP
jgi:hypothetical protein